jgi:hypothetical protein
MNLIDMCTNPYILRVMYILVASIKIVCIIVPIIIIGTTMIKAFQAVVSGKDDDLKAILPISVKKIIAGLIIFFLPTILNFCFSLIGDTSYEINLCESNLTMETITYYETLLPVEEKILQLENNPTQQNLIAAQNAVQGITGYATEDTMLDYQQRISAAKNKVDAYSKQLDCRRQGGTYKDGYCKIPPKVQTGSSGDITSSPGTGTISESTLLNGNYKVIEPAVSVKSYLNTISSNRISQNNDTSIYGDQCLAFAYIHAYSLYSGDTSKRAKDSLDYVYASKFNGYVNDDKDAVLTNIYNELVQGKPVIIQVNGNKAGTSRHYVTVVGFKKDVRNARDLEESDLLIIDSWDGKLEPMGEQGSRFMVTGAACHKKYTGYQMYYVE